MTPVTQVSRQNTRGTINVELRSKNGTPRVHYRAELLSENMRKIESFWHDGALFTFPEVAYGLYIVRVALVSPALELEQIVEVNAPGVEVKFNLDEGPQYKSYDFKRHSKTLRDLDDDIILYDDLIVYDRYAEASDPGYVEIDDPPTTGSSSGGEKSWPRRKTYTARLWTFSDGTWRDEILTEMAVRLELNRPYRLNYGEGMKGIEISRSDLEPKFVMMPTGKQISCTVTEVPVLSEDTYPLDVSFVQADWRANTLLDLITRGSMKEARSLLSLREAEELLRQKMIDPIAATVGGYFILKSGQLQYLHDWANNLANLYECRWLPDGAIIHGWQMMIEDREHQRQADQVKRRFTEALGRGIPMFTEGVRLLYEGLQQLSAYYKHRDAEVEHALTTVQKMAAHADWSEPYTTFHGILPDEINQPAGRPVATPEATGHKWNEQQSNDISQYEYS